MLFSGASSILKIRLSVHGGVTAALFGGQNKEKERPKCEGQTVLVCSVHWPWKARNEQTLVLSLSTENKLSFECSRLIRLLHKMMAVTDNSDCIQSADRMREHTVGC